MENNSDNGEKTENPTTHHLKKSKEKGQTPRFTAVSILTGLLGGMVGLSLSWVTLSGSIKSEFTNGLKVAQRTGWRDMDIGAALLENALFACKVMLPFLMTVFIISTVGAYCVGGFSLSWHRVGMQLNRCSPIKGWQQWMGRDAWIHVVGACVKCLSVALVFVGLVKTQHLRVLSFGQYNAIEGSSQVIHWCFMAALTLLSPLIVWSLIEVVYQKWSFFEQMKMSKQDIKEEIKQEEGLPEIKMKIRQHRYQRLTDKTEMNLKTATVLITDGGERCVVLRYAKDETDAPVLVVKGLGVKSKQLQKMACRYGIPAVTDTILAAQLFTQGIVGRLIPEALYKAVAKILADITQSKSNQTGS